MKPNDLPYNYPDASGHFGPYGGSFVSETLVFALEDLKVAYAKLKDDPAFKAEFARELKHFVGRPSPIYHARRWSDELGGAQIYFKREDLNHTGAHKVNNTIGQALLARAMGKPRVIAETGAGQHGVATATVAARFGMKCVVYMGSTDVARQAANVYRMKLLGAEVVPVESGSKTLKDALNEAMRDWVTNVEDTFYIIGTVAGPHPYPAMVRDFNSVVGKECLWQMPELIGHQPDIIVACVGGGSNAMGIFYDYIDKPGVRLIGVEAGGEGVQSGHHAASLLRAPLAFCMATVLTCCKMPMAKSRKPIRFRLGLTILASAPSMHGLKTLAGPSTYPSTTKKRSMPFTIAVVSRALSLRSRQAMPLPMPPSLRRAYPKTSPSW